MRSTRTLLALFWLALLGGVAAVLYVNGEFAAPAQLPGGPTDRLIIGLQEKLEDEPGDVALRLELGNAYVQKIRETADSSLYGQIETLLDEAAEREPANAEIPFLRATVLAGRHRFKEALPFAQSAVDLRPDVPRYYGVLSDIQVELGRYDDAVGTLQTMVDTRPDFASFSRISHLRELNGETAGAIDAMKKAIAAGSPYPENLAWAYVELGKLQLAADPAEAERSFLAARRLDPGFARAVQGLGRVALARGEREKALAHFQEAFDLLPITEHAADLGDVHALLGDDGKARELYTAVAASFDQFERGGVVVDLERAAFLADRDIDLPLALEKARVAYAERASVDAADTLAWALFKNGRTADAKEKIAEAMRLKGSSAQILYHAALIAEADGDRDGARRYLRAALELNPHFSILHGPKAQQRLTSLASSAR